MKLLIALVPTLLSASISLIYDGDREVILSYEFENRVESVFIAQPYGKTTIIEFVEQTSSKKKSPPPLIQMTSCSENILTQKSKLPQTSIKDLGFIGPISTSLFSINPFYGEQTLIKAVIKIRFIDGPKKNAPINNFNNDQLTRFKSFVFNTRAISNLQPTDLESYDLLITSSDQTDGFSQYLKIPNDPKMLKAVIKQKMRSAYPPDRIFISDIAPYRKNGIDSDRFYELLDKGPLADVEVYRLRGDKREAGMSIYKSCSVNVTGKQIAILPTTLKPNEHVIEIFRTNIQREKTDLLRARLQIFEYFNGSNLIRKYLNGLFITY